MLDNNFVKLIAWYDNEWGYTNKILDLMAHMHERGQRTQSEDLTKRGDASPPFFDFPPVRPAEASLRKGSCHGPARRCCAPSALHP